MSEIIPNKKLDLKTIVFTHGGGRFGNQLFSYAQLLAFVFEENNIDIVNIAFWEYADLLEISKKDKLCTKSMDLKRNIFFRLLQKICTYFHIKNNSSLKRIMIYLMYLYGHNPFAKYYHSQSISSIDGDFLFCEKLQKINLADPEGSKIIRKAKTTFLSGWGICSWQLVEKHQQKIREFLKIRQDYIDISNNFILEKRENYNFLIGVMIRQGDYQHYQNGRHYFSTEQYSYWINELSKLFKERGKIGFIVSSDTPQKLQDFSNKDVYFTTGIAGGNGHYIESMVELSLCDIIVSVPSTFSMWAAFIGNIPILPLIETGQVLSQDSLLSNNLFDYVSLDC
jgi:Glycosyl transferase family 11